jgi:hypothetical protein
MMPSLWYLYEKNAFLHLDRSIMARYTLYVDIQQGFKDDTVIVKVNGNDVFAKEHKTTSPLVGPAASSSIPIDEGLAMVQALVPHRNLQGSLEFQVDSDIYLGISINKSNEKERIGFLKGDRPFDYF